ncbi:MAG: IclR family transcriptional regulator [Deltaproteobacteria bacterium]|nr:IclR family transcriptional regulator [Deltaproteobacteria bacterium]
MDATTSVEKALDVLFHLHGAGAAGVSEIARALALPKSTTHRLLGSLLRRGLVEQDEQGRYRPGLRLVALGLGVLDREPVVAAARPQLEAEARATGETLFLAAARGGRVVVLDKVEGTGFLRASPRVGEEVPLPVTATGLLHLAFAPESVARSASTPSGFAERQALAREVALARRRGWAQNREEWIPGLAVVAAPVLAAGRLVAVVALAAPAVRLPAGQTGRFARRVVAAAERIGATLEGRSAA